MNIPRLPFVTCRFTLTGLNLERFMNTLQKEGVPLLSARRADRRTLECACYLRDLPRVRQLAGEKGWRVTRERPAQLAAVLGALRRRPGALLGAALALAAALVLSQFVWRVEINGAGPYRADIAAYLQEAGYVPGARRDALDASALERSLTLRYPEVAWFHAYVSNVTLVVDVTRGVPMPDLPSAQPGDVVALRDGIVDSVRVYAGTAAVQAGDAVRAGQVLIRGEERGADGAVVPVAARGAVTARCWLTHTVEMSMLEIHSEETGREAAVQQIVTPWFSLPAEPETPDFLASNAYITQTPVVGCFFPVWRKTTVLREVSLEYARRPEAEVRAEAGDAALERLKTLRYGYEIIDKWVDYCMIEDDTLAATATAEWLMDIAGPAPA